MQTSAQLTVEIGNTVTYQSPGYSFSNGRVTGLDEVQKRALVYWTDSDGRSHERFCGVEFLTKTNAAQAIGEDSSAA